MDIKENLNKLGLDTNNSIVVGSGILSALNLRESKDIDLVVSEKKFIELSANSNFKRLQISGREILSDGLFEIGTTWGVLGTAVSFQDLLNSSIIINDVRYCSIDYLLKVKRYWIMNGGVRQKDGDDVKLIEQYLANK